MPRSRPQVVAHRGASGHRPEHTLDAYRTAIRMGVDDIELDLVATRDGVLVARHDLELSVTTDVAERPDFAHLRRTLVVDGVAQRGWFVQDFTLAELKTLATRERMPGTRPANTAYDGAEGVPTLTEVLAMVGAVVGEYLGAARGLGYVISQAEGTFDTTGVFAGMVVLGVVVVIVGAGVKRLEAWLLRWKYAA